MSELKPCPRCNQKLIVKGKAISIGTPKVIRKFYARMGYTCIVCGYHARSKRSWNRRAEEDG